MGLGPRCFFTSASHRSLEKETRKGSRGGKEVTGCAAYYLMREVSCRWQWPPDIPDPWNYASQQHSLWNFVVNVYPWHFSRANESIFIALWSLIHFFVYCNNRTLTSWSLNYPSQWMPWLCFGDRSALYSLCIPHGDNPIIGIPLAPLLTDEHYLILQIVTLNT